MLSACGNLDGKVVPSISTSTPSTNYPLSIIVLSVLETLHRDVATRVDSRIHSHTLGWCHDIARFESEESLCCSSLIQASVVVTCHVVLGGADWPITPIGYSLVAWRQSHDILHLNTIVMG